MNNHIIIIIVHLKNAKLFESETMKVQKAKRSISYLSEKQFFLYCQILKQTIPAK